MITSAKNYTKKITLRQMVKANLYRQNHTKKHIPTHSQKEEKEKIYIYLCIKKRKKEESDQISKQIYQ